MSEICWLMCCQSSERGKILEQTSGFCKVGGEVRAVATCYKVMEYNEVCIKGSGKVDQSF